MSEMVLKYKGKETIEYKLHLLSDAAKYDVACTSSIFLSVSSVGTNAVYL